MRMNLLLVLNAGFLKTTEKFFADSNRLKAMFKISNKKFSGGQTTR